MRTITLLGHIAAIGRKLGLGLFVQVGREVFDKFCLALRIFPLKIEIDGVRLHGLFRHRSFLASLNSEYEPYTRQLFLEALQENTLVVDGGAHIGLYTCLAAKYLPKGEILAIEPDPFNFAALNFNCSRYSNVILAPKAIGHRNGKVTFFSSYGTIGGSLIFRSEIGLQKCFEVEMVTVDSLLDGKEASHLVIKLDLEGAEPLALQGMSSTVERFKLITIILEHNPQALHEGGFSTNDIIRPLQSMGFVVWFIDEQKRTLVPVDESSNLPKGNLWAQRWR